MSSILNKTKLDASIQNSVEISICGFTIAIETCIALECYSSNPLTKTIHWIMLLPQKGLNIKIQTTIKEPNETEIESPYHVPFQGIVRYSSLGKVFLMGDFNARTVFVLWHFSWDVLQEPALLGLSWRSTDSEDLLTWQSFGGGLYT